MRAVPVAQRFRGYRFTADEWRQVCASYGDRCAICGAGAGSVVLTVDHIKPVSDGGTDDLENIRPLCGACNSRCSDGGAWRRRRAAGLPRTGYRPARFHLSPEAVALLGELSRSLGVPPSGVVELALRHLSKQNERAA